MDDSKKTKDQLIQELAGLRKRVAELEELNSSGDQASGPFPEKSLTVQTVGNNLQSGMIYQVIRENDGSRRFTYLSDTVRRFYGITPEQGLGDSSLIYGRVHEEDRARVFREEEEANSTLSPFQNVVRMIDPNGAIRWSLFMSHPKRQADGSTCWDGIELDITDRKKAEEALRRSEEKFVKIFQTSPDAVAISRNSDGTYLDVNEGFSKLSGYAREELIGHSPLPGDLNFWLSGEDRETFAATLQETGEALGIEIPFRRQDGAIRTCILSARVLDIKGENCHISIVSDITERKEAEQALKYSEERFRLFMDYSPTVAWIKDAQGRYVYLSKTYERRYGVPTGDWYGKTDQDIWPSKTADLFQKNDKQVWETGAPIEVVEEIDSPNGDQQFWLITKFPFQDAFGNRYVAGIGLDITERRRVQQALRQSEERHRVIIQTAMDGFWMVDMDGRLLEVNDTYCRLSGYSEQDLLSMHIADLDAKETRSDVSNQMHLIKSQGETRFESKHRRKDGSLFDVEVSAKYRPTEGGRFEVFLRDITDRKKKEKEIKQTQNRLRALSARLQTIREEERASIAREIHDNLGQLLTGIKMDVSWFLRHPYPDLPKLQEKVQGINQLVDQTVEAVRRISTELRPRILDDFGLVAALEWQTEEFAKKTGIPCLFRSNVRQLDLKSDRSIAVFRIFQEALTNVARHAEATNVEASLKKNAKSLVLTIQDTGRGISGDEVANHQSLGLVGMRERALILGGTVEVKGKKGKGTKVLLSLPVAE